MPSESGRLAIGAWRLRLESGFLTIEHMTIKRMEHVGIVVDDLAAATEFFVELGLELQGEGQVEGGWVDRIIGLDGVQAEIAMLQTPDGHGRLELVKFHSPPTQGGDRHAPANTPGIRHLAFARRGHRRRRRRPASPRHRARRRAGALRGQLPALLRPRPRGDHRRAGREDRLTGPVRRRPPTNRSTRQEVMAATCAPRVIDIAFFGLEEDFLARARIRGACSGKKWSTAVAAGRTAYSGGGEL